MKQILIDDVIYPYYGINADSIRRELEDVPAGEGVEIVIHSPGGSVSEGVAIFNLIRDFARENEVTVYIFGMAASMASYVALAAKIGNPSNRIIVEDNSIYMIHNAWTYVEGDYREMSKQGQWLERISALLAQAYAAVSGKSVEKIRALMDEETYFLGQEIVDFGFADEIRKATSDAAALDKDALIAKARLAFEAAMAKAKPDVEIKNIAAVLAQIKDDKNLAMPETGLVENREEKMSMEEIKAKFPAEYAQIFAAGEESGVAKERKRVCAHLKAGEASSAMEIAAKNIRDGKTFGDEEVQAEYFEAGMKHKLATARANDTVQPITTPEPQGSDDAVMSAFCKTLGIKE